MVFLGPSRISVDISSRNLLARGGADDRERVRAAFLASTKTERGTADPNSRAG